MSTLELKSSIIGLINQETDPRFLNYIMNIIKSKETVYYPTESEWKQIEQAREDYRNGRVVSHNEHKKMIDKWLEE